MNRYMLPALLLLTTLLLACGRREAAPLKDDRSRPIAPSVATVAARTPTTPAATVTPTAARGIRIEAMLLPPGRPVEANVRLEAPDPNTPLTLTVEARLARPGAHPVHLHGGSCTTPSASASMLGTLTAGADGRATLRVTSVTGVGGATALTFMSIQGSEVAIDVHDPAGAVVVCADLVRIGER